MSRLTLRIVIVQASLALYLGGEDEAGLLGDPGFESPAVPANSFQYFNGKVDAWTYTQNSGIDYGAGGTSAAPAPPEGSQAAILQSMGSSFGSITQSASLTAGTDELSFLESNRNVDVFGTAVFSVSIVGYSSGIIHAPSGFTTFESGAFKLASSGTYTLTFSAPGGTGTTTNSNDYTTILDNVNLLPVVPEPSSLPLCGIAVLVGLGLASVYSKRAAARWDATVLPGHSGYRSVIVD